MVYTVYSHLKLRQLVCSCSCIHFMTVRETVPKNNIDSVIVITIAFFFLILFCSLLFINIGCVYDLNVTEKLSTRFISTSRWPFCGTINNWPMVIGLDQHHTTTKTEQLRKQVSYSRNKEAN